MIRRRRRSDFHQTKTGNERWLVSYADFVTLLFAFFVVMYSVSQVSEKKYQVLSDTLSSVFMGKVPVDAEIKKIIDQYPLDDKGKISGLSPTVNLVDTKTLASEIQQALINMVDPSDAKITATEDWVQIDVNSNLLFPSASASPSKDAKQIFSDIAKVLAPYTNEVEVSGYTDNIPISNQTFNSNWELSSARASSIVRLLESAGVSSERLSAVGYGEYRPVADNQTEEGRKQNRRVVLMVAKQKIARSTQDLNDLQSDFPLSPLSQNPLSPNPLNSNQITPSDSKPNSPVESEPQSPTELESSPGLAPVRLKNGGLLFTSDPSSSR